MQISRISRIGNDMSNIQRQMGDSIKRMSSGKMLSKDNPSQILKVENIRTKISEQKYQV